jgi:trimethylguanosine synthase
MEPYNIGRLHSSFRAFSNEVALFLPRTSDLRQLAQFDNGGKKMTVVHYCMEGASKALCVYFGDLVI